MTEIFLWVKFCRFWCVQVKDNLNWLEGTGKSDENCCKIRKSSLTSVKLNLMHVFLNTKINGTDVANAVWFTCMICRILSRRCVIDRTRHDRYKDLLVSDT